MVDYPSPSSPFYSSHGSPPFFRSISCCVPYSGRATALHYPTTGFFSPWICPPNPPPCAGFFSDLPGSPLRSDRYAVLIFTLLLFPMYSFFVQPCYFLRPLTFLQLNGSCPFSSSFPLLYECTTPWASSLFARAAFILKAPFDVAYGTDPPGQHSLPVLPILLPLPHAHLVVQCAPPSFCTDAHLHRLTVDVPKQAQFVSFLVPPSPVLILFFLLPPLPWLTHPLSSAAPELADYLCRFGEVSYVY